MLKNQRIGDMMSLSRDIFVGALIAALCTGPALAGDGPRADVRPPIWDFGFLPQKSEVSHLFYLCNTGTAPLEVTKIKPGCSCTSVSELDRPIAPGDSAAIMVTFKSGRYHRKTKMTTKIHTNDPETPVQDLRIFTYVVKRGDETGPVSVEPQKLTWEVERQNDPVTVDTLKIDNHGTDSLIVAVRHAPEGIAERIAFPEGTLLGPKAELSLHLTREPFPDESNGPSLTLAFIGRDTTLMTIPIQIKD